MIEDDVVKLQKIVSDKIATLEFQKQIMRNVKADLSDISGRVHRLDLLMRENETHLAQIQTELLSVIEELRS